MANDKGTGQVNVPYQFYVSDGLHKKAMDKATETGLDLAPFMRIAMERFVAEKPERLISMLTKYNRRQQNNERNNNK